MIIAIAKNNERGTANSTILTCWDLGMGLGILFGGTVVEYAGYATAFWWMAAMHVAGALLFFLATKKAYLKRKLDVQ